MFKFLVEKYRSIEDIRDLTSEQVQQIATMQSIQASLLEYYYQFQIAVESQSKLNEIAYTVAITVITTALTMGIGSAAGWVKQGIISSLITEPLEEVFIDPVLEAVVSRFVEILGGDEYAQMIASTLAESGREGAFGITSQKGAREMRQLNQQYKSEGLSRSERRQRINAEIKAQQQEVSTTSKVAKVALMTLSIFGMLTGIGGIFGGLGGLGITSLSAFLIDNEGSFIDFFRDQQEQLGIDQDPLQGASQVAVSGLPQIPSYNIKLSYISNYIKNMKGVFDVSDTQKPKATWDMVTKLAVMISLQGKNLFRTENGLYRKDAFLLTMQYLASQDYDIGELTFWGALPPKKISNARFSGSVASGTFTEIVSMLQNLRVDLGSLKRGTILIRSLFTIIKNYETEIVKFEQNLKNKLGLTITKKYGNIGYTDSISAAQKARILGASETTVAKWTNDLTNLVDINPHQSSVLKMKTHLKLFSSSIIYKAFARAFKDYDTIIDEISEIFVEYIDIPLEQASGEWLSFLLKRAPSFISVFVSRLGVPKRSEQLVKYINLLVSIQLIEEKNLKYPMKKGEKLVNLIEKCHELIFQRLKKMGMIADIGNPSTKHYAERVLKGQLSIDNRELFDIVIHSLVALSKAHRNKNPQDKDYIFPLSELSKEGSFSSDSLTLFTGKFRQGRPLLKTQGRRLIEFLRKNFHYNPEGVHDVIYETRRHIAEDKRIWYWNKYNIHFEDLYTPQTKAFFDVTFGLNVFSKEFLVE